MAFDDPLFEVSTDKVDSEIPSPYDGVIVEILVGAGETVPVGTPLVRIGGPGGPPRRCPERRGCLRRRTGWPLRAVPRSMIRRARPWAGQRGWPGRTLVTASRWAWCTTSLCPSWVRRLLKAPSGAGSSRSATRWRSTTRSMR
ncbi:MAG TPA: biotin/lipoyl-containing protein [Sporichthyaceae bacterium]